MLVLSMLAACHSRDAGTMKPQDAAHWLKETCGITFDRDPVVLPGTSISATAATVVLPETEVASTLEALRNNRSLHRRGQSDTRYSYESYPGASAGKLCELDTSLHVLYFSYTDGSAGS